MNYQKNRFSQNYSEDLNRDFEAVNRALRVLSACTQAVIRATDEATLLQTLCNLITEEAAYRMAWVGYVCYDEAKSVTPVASSGFEDGYLKTVNITWADTERGQGPSGRAIRAQKPIACQNMTTDPRYGPWREAAQKRGYESSLGLPLCDQGDVFGVLSIYSAEAEAFNNGELQLLTELADSLSFGIITLRRKEALQESEQRYRQLVQTQSDLICRSLPDTTITFANESLCRVLGFSLEELKGKKWLDFANPNDLQNILERISQLTPEKPSFLSENRYARVNGQIGWTQWINQGIFNTQGELIDIQSVGRDITELKQVESALRESEERYRLLAENINDLVCIHQPDGKYLYVSLSCESLLGYTYDEMMQTEPYTLCHPEDRDRIIQDNIASMQTIKSIPITYRMRHKSGDYIWFETLTKPILDSKGQIIRLQTTSRDVTERILAQNQLKYEALHDTLTGLPNRLLLMERLELAINRINSSENYHFGVLFLDLDRFKVINDSLGHLTGDQLLIIMAQKLQSIIRTTDLAARLGGDEFVILLDDIKDIQDCIRVTERIFAELTDPLMIETREIYINTSIGIVFGSKDYENATQLLRDADIAMYRAKNQGKARYEIFNAQMHAEAIIRLHLENDLRQALAKLTLDKTHPEFVLYYQPIIALETEQLAGFEALIRWIHPTKGLIPPGEFIPIAEETGLITLLDYWVLGTACEQLSAWQKILPHTSHLKVSVNLTAPDLRQKNLLQEVDRVLSETNLPSHCLILEITESMLIDDIDHTITVLENLKKRGIKISIDDFGTGYSSLSYLHRLPVDNLKVDRSFVNQIQEDYQRKEQIIKTIITLSDNLELNAIAEGIETRQQLERLQQLKYQFGQGYLFSKPLSSDDALEFIKIKMVSTSHFD